MEDHEIVHLSAALRRDQADSYSIEIVEATKARLDFKFAAYNGSWPMFQQHIVRYGTALEKMAIAEMDLSIPGASESISRCRELMERRSAEVIEKLYEFITNGGEDVDARTRLGAMREWLKHAMPEVSAQGKYKSKDAWSLEQKERNRLKQLMEEQGEIEQVMLRRGTDFQEVAVSFRGGAPQTVSGDLPPNRSGEVSPDGGE